MTQPEIKKLIAEQDLTITDVIDAVIEMNGLIGVGLIDLEEHISAYIKTQRKNKSKVSTEAWLNS